MPDRRSGAARFAPVAIFAALGLVLVGCRLDVAANVVLDADGSGTVGIVFHLDEALLDELDAMGVDPTAELEAAVLADDVWELERISDGDQLTLSLERPVDHVAQFGDALRDLVAGLSSADPALLIDIEVTVDDQGASEVTGVVTFRPPSTAGLTLDDEPFGPAGEDLTAIVERAVRPALHVTLPGQVQSHDADEVDGRRLRWEVPIGTDRSIAGTAAPAPWWQDHLLWLAAGAGALLLVLVAVLVLALRRRRRSAATAGP